MANSVFKSFLHDRTQAGRLLAYRLMGYANRRDVVVCALPRGGVPVGAEIAHALKVPLTVFLVRKLGVPGHEELAMGAITSGGMKLVDGATTSSLHISEDVINAVASLAGEELSRRERLYCRGRCTPDLKGKIVVLTGDGIATGSTMFLAAEAVRRQGAGRVIVAVPVAPMQAASQLNRVADEVICLAEPEPFEAVGNWYKDFHQLTDHEVCEILGRQLEEQDRRCPTGSLSKTA